MDYNKLYSRTLENCRFYDRTGDDARLLNEIGALRGIAYCMEGAGLCPHDPALRYFIARQNALLEKEARP